MVAVSVWVALGRLRGSREYESLNIPSERMSDPWSNCPQAIRRLMIAFFLACLFGSAASAAPLERWVYAQVNLLVPEEAQRLETLMRRARPLGFRYFLLADSKFTRISQMDARYHDHLKRLKQVASELGIARFPRNLCSLDGISTRRHADDNHDGRSTTQNDDGRWF